MPLGVLVGVRWDPCDARPATMGHIVDDHAWLTAELLQPDHNRIDERAQRRGQVPAMIASRCASRASTACSAGAIASVTSIPRAMAAPPNRRSL